MILAIAPTEKEALAISRRGVDGLVRRTKQSTPTTTSCSRRPTASGRSRRSTTSWPHRGRVAAGAGAPSRSPSGSPRVLETGLVDHIALQVPTGDMTYDEARRTVELFATEVKPALEKQFAG